MATPGGLGVPALFKPIASYYKLATDNDSIDPVIGYWCRLFVCQKAMKIDSKSAEARTFLVALMDELEKVGNSPVLICHLITFVNRLRRPYRITRLLKMRLLPRLTRRTMDVKFLKARITKIEVETQLCMYFVDK